MAGPCVDNLIDVFREDKAESFPQDLCWRKLSNTIYSTGHGSRHEPMCFDYNTDVQV